MEIPILWLFNSLCRKAFLYDKTMDTILLGIMKIENPQSWLTKPSPVNRKVHKIFNLENALSIEITSAHKDGLSGSFISSFVIDKECKACDSPQKTDISILHVIVLIVAYIVAYIVKV